MTSNNSYTAIIYRADKEHKEDKDICIIEGECPKCGSKSGNNSLIIYDYKMNKVKKNDSIIKFICIVCSKKSSVYYKNVINVNKEE